VKKETSKGLHQPEGHPKKGTTDVSGGGGVRGGGGKRGESRREKTD